MALTEARRTGEFILAEGNGTISREAVTVVSGQNLAAGTVVGKITKAGTASAAAFAGNTGNGAMGAITVSAGAKAGVYKLTVVEPAADAGAFQVEDPDGVVIGTGNVASAFSAGGLAFTLADGTANFIAGDGFNITVAAGSGKHKAYNANNTDGSEVAAGILYEAVDASLADAPGVIIARHAEVAEVHLTGIDAGGKTQLAALGIVVR